MPASFTNGHTFTQGEEVNDVDLHELIESATVAGVDRANLDDDIFVITKTVGGNPPSGVASRETWSAEEVGFPVRGSGSGIFGVVPWSFPFLNTGAEIEPGMLLMVTDDYSGTGVKLAPATSESKVIGVSATRVPVDGRGVCVFRGVVMVKFESNGVTSRGTAFKLSSTAGLAETAAVAGSGASYRLGTQIRTAKGQFAWCHVRIS